MGSTRRAMGLAVAFAIAPLAACSLLVDTRGLAGPDVVDGGARDGPVSPGDADATTDASAEAAADAAPRGCAALVPPPKLCQDFDESTTLADGWTEVTTSAGGTTRIALDSTVAFSAPRSAKMSLVGAPSCSFDKLERRWPDATARRVDARLRLRPSGPWKRATTTFVIVFKGPPSNATSCQLLFNLDSDGTTLTNAAVLVQSGPMFKTTRYGLSAAPQPDAWTEVGMSVREVGGVPIVSATVGGKPALADTPAPDCALGGGVELGVGFHCDDGSAEMRVDDVIFDFQ